MKYRTKVVEIDAIKLTWDDWSAVCKFAEVGRLSEGAPERAGADGGQIALMVPTPTGVARADQNDWIIRHPDGYLDVCKWDVFPTLYEPCE